MKNILMIFLFCSCFCSIKGQNKEKFRPQLGIGFHAGLNRSSILFDPVIGQEPVDLYSAGFLINYINEPYLGFQVEFNLSQRGWQENSDTANNYSRTLEYFEIPVLTHIYIPINNIRINFDLGPYLAFYQGVDEKYDYTVRNNTFHGLQQNATRDSAVLGEINYYGKDIDNHFDYGFMGGMGVGYQTLLGEFQLRFRFTQGLVNVFAEYPKGNFRVSQSRSYYIGFSYCYSIKFKQNSSRK